MNPLIASLVKNHPVLTDGGWGTQLQARGMPLNACADEWNLSHPAEVQAIADAYVKVGSTVILTNTFGANRVRLQEFGLADKVVQINRAGAEISKRAVNGWAFVYASIGPCGIPLTKISRSELEDAFFEQAQALKAGGADALVLETMSDIEEIAIALRAAKSTGLPVVACMSFGSRAGKDRTFTGTTVEAAMAELTRLGADIVGANCGNGIENHVELCQRMRAATTLPLWIKANAGLPEMVDGKAVYRTSPRQFASYGLALVHAGASFIGGCCGTTPDHIRALGAAISTDSDD